MTDSRTAEVLGHLDSHRAALEQAVALVPPTQRDRRHTAERWSVAEVLEHLAIVEGGITRLLVSLLEGARAAAVDAAQESPVPERLDMSRVLDRSRRITAGEASLPREGLDWEVAWMRLAARRDTLRALVLSDGERLGHITALHPVFGTLDGYGWVEFVAGHEGRHARQVREIGEAVRDS